VQGKFTTVNLLVFRNALKAPKAEIFFSVARFSLKLISLAKWERRKRTLEWLGELRQEIKEIKVRQNNCAWIIFQRVSMSPTIRRSQIHRSCISLLLLSSFQFFYRTVRFFFYSFIRVASFRFFTHWCIFRFILHAFFAVSGVFTCLLRCFRSFKLVHVFNLVYGYLQLNRITPNTKKCLVVRATVLINWVLIQFATSAQVTGADPGFLSGGGAPLRNDVTDRWGKQILKANTKKKASSQGGGGGCAPPAPSP